MSVFGGFLDASPTHPFIYDFIFLVYERYSGGAYLGEGSFMVHLQFLSFQISNDFLAAESTISGWFLDGFLAITPLKCSKIILNFWPVM